MKISKIITIMLILSAGLFSCTEEFLNSLPKDQLSELLSGKVRTTH